MPRTPRRPPAPSTSEPLRLLRLLALLVRASALRTCTAHPHGSQHATQAAAHVVAASLFASGFLLTRTELSGVSTCFDAAVHTSASAAVAAPSSYCLPAQFNKAVVLLVDGLRWDVAAGTARSAFPGRALSLPALHSLGAQLGRPSVLTRFVADPPTTTQQRLKGLLTGAFPPPPFHPSPISMAV